MRQSQLFSKTQRQAPKDEVSLNAQLLIRGGFVDKLMAGVYTLLPLGWKVYKKVEQIIREEMNAIGGQELGMPALHPKENWERTGRWDIMDDLFKLPIGDNRELALGPTHEEIISPLAKKMISSYKDLPKAVYQFQNKFRNEKRAKSGLMRGREFVMKDLYSFHVDQSDLNAYYDKATIAYINVFNRCGIGDKTYLTYASGGSFAKYSHEFQTLTDAGEDLIHICSKCHIAINKEIMDDLEGKCPQCGSPDLTEEKAVEVGNIFKLGTKYSEPFDLTYIDSNGHTQTVVMGCYGIGLQRLIGTVVEVCNDNRGIIWPESISPFKIHLIALNYDKTEIKTAADELYDKLILENIEVLFDDRPDITAGEKFADADLIGCTYRIVISEKTLASKSIELKKRSAENSEMISLKEIVSKLKQ